MDMEFADCIAPPPWFMTSVMPPRPDERQREESIVESRKTVRSLRSELLGIRKMLDDIIARVDEDDIVPDEDSQGE